MCFEQDTKPRIHALSFPNDQWNWAIMIINVRVRKERDSTLQTTRKCIFTEKIIRFYSGYGAKLAGIFSRPGGSSSIQHPFPNLNLLDSLF
jgi:hypothetical protein